MVKGSQLHHKVEKMLFPSKIDQVTDFFYIFFCHCFCCCRWRVVSVWLVSLWIQYLSTGFSQLVQSPRRNRSVNHCTEIKNCFCFPSSRSVSLAVFFARGDDFPNISSTLFFHSSKHKVLKWKLWQYITSPNVSISANFRLFWTGTIQINIFFLLVPTYVCF